jgi:hypothetical protein
MRIPYGSNIGFLDRSVNIKLLNLVRVRRLDTSTIRISAPEGRNNYYINDRKGNIIVEDTQSGKIAERASQSTVIVGEDITGRYAKNLSIETEHRNRLNLEPALIFALNEDSSPN